MIIPKRSRREPLIEVIWQVIFWNAPTAAPGQLLLGILYGHLRKKGEEWQVQALPLAQIPPFVAQQDPVLRYAVTHRLEVKGKSILYQIGDRVLSVNCRRPYVGWEAFRESILDIANLIQETIPVVAPSSYALRYLELFTKEDVPDLKALRLNITVGEQTITEQSLHLRVELSYKGRDHVLQVIYPSQVQLPDGGQFLGTLIDLETKAKGASGWTGFSEELEELLMASKAMFFEQVLSPELIERLEPDY